MTLQQVTSAAATAIVGAGILAGVLALVVTRRPPLALGVLLDLLVAAGLLRLVGNRGWQLLLTTGVILVLRRLVGAGFRAAGHSWSGEVDEPARRPTARRRPPSLGRLVRPAWRL